MNRTRSFQLHRLESRLNPNGTTALITRGLPGTASATAGGASLLNYDGYYNYTARSDIRVASDDGRFVVYTSTAINLVAGQADDNATADVFLHDRLGGQTVLVSRAHTSPLRAADAGGSSPAISADGRFVVFRSLSRDLIANYAHPPGGEFNVYLFDRLDASVTLVSRDHAAPQTGANGRTQFADLSADGRFVVYTSEATNLIAGWQSGWQVTSPTGEVYAYDRLTQTTQLISHPPGLPTTTGDTGVGSARISGDGRYVTYIGYSSNLIDGFSSFSFQNIFQYDRQTQMTTLISRSHTSPTTGGNGESPDFRVSDDGRFIAFLSEASDIVPGFIDGNGNGADLYYHDRQTGQTVLVSQSKVSPNQGANDRPEVYSMSGYGNVVVFNTAATDLIGGASGYQSYAYDTASASISLVSRMAADAKQGASLRASFSLASPDGRYVIFICNTPDLVAGYQPGTEMKTYDAFRHDRLTGVTVHTPSAMKAVTSPT